ncbi:flagellar motor switch phosphatase FliY [Lacticigenium naphthae]|uniref:flagellar motor switch phosphatase FliY n=1 Tax=Lacticigenium naphthae TaxID=515351 RepID=UPI000413AA85|nr:flagellar motor switch phosphatase FliY [Lacticigenium naphthae]
MSSNALTQEEIDALLNGGGAASEKEDSQSCIDKDQQDIVGEIANISMSQSATALSTLLNRTVNITTPTVECVPYKDMIKGREIPKVVTTILFKEGLKGSNVLMIDVPDASVIADLMMGNDGKDVNPDDFGELELSAVGEAMNQMIGSASTAMATMLKRKIDIQPPQVALWHTEDDIPNHPLDEESHVVTVAFNLSVEGLIDSEIMQIFPVETVRELSDIVMNDSAEVLNPQPQAAQKSASEQQAPQQQSAPEQKVTVQQPAFQQLEESGKTHSPRNLDLIMDVPLDFSVVLGESRKTIKDILALGTGSVIELEKMTDEPLEIYVNGKLIAEGEVVVINENFGVRITNILSKEQRIRHLK